jgi:esterase/lipase
MTNSYNLSPHPKVVFFHGLNNNPQSFGPIIKHFRDAGFETEFITLPGHGDDRHEARDIKAALRTFDQAMKKLKGAPYVAIAFSHGALYLQIWLEKNLEYRPMKQVLLAPALFIHRQKIIEKLLKFLPTFFVIKSLSPKAFRRYQILSAWEYNILVQGMLIYQKIKKPFKIPTMVLIDPKDELVDAAKLKAELEKMNPDFRLQLFERNYLKKGLGQHHILFHPEYFNEEDWFQFTSQIKDFFLDVNE